MPLKNMSWPVDVKDVQRLVGLANYLTRFLKKLADICEPLRQLTRKVVEWHWSNVHENAFKKIKPAASQALVLRYFDPTKETVLQCDPSDTGLGATLLQKRPASGIRIPILDQYGAQLCPNRERTASQCLEQRILTSTHMVAKLPSRVTTNHLKLSTANPSWQRMLLCLQKYDLEIGFKPGQHMYLADTFSRAPLPITKSRDEVLTIDKEIEMIQMVGFLPLCKVSLEEIRKESLWDSTIQALQKVIQSGWPETKNNLPHDVTLYFNVCDELSAQDGIVFKGDRCVVPKSLRPEVLSRIHRSHIGIEGCLRLARESVYWPGMSAAVKNAVSQCETC